MLLLTRSNSDQLRENALLKKYYCDINIDDLNRYNEEIAHRLLNEPADIIPLVSFRTCQCYKPRTSDSLSSSSRP